MTEDSYYKTVYVVSFVAYSSDDQEEATSGGFDWFVTLEGASEAYGRELVRCIGLPFTHRLVRYSFPTYGLEWTPDAITRMIDHNLDDVESGTFGLLMETKTFEERKLVGA